MLNSTAIAMLIYFGIYNVSIGRGAFWAEVVAQDLSTGYIGLIGGINTAIELIYTFFVLIPR